MGDAKLDPSRSDAATENVEAEIREMVRGKKAQDENLPDIGSDPDLGSDIVKVGAESIAEIDKLMVELQAARDYLHSEGERVRRMADRYGHLTRTASASVRIISDSLGKWRNPDLAVVVSSNSELPKELLATAGP